MGGLFVITLGLAVWIIGWSFGLKSFDVFMVSIFIAVLVATAQITGPFVKRVTRRTPDPDA
ncbi:MAG: hypothetical protein H0T15_02335 [Thermoleophilaceae bacterium]|nr:hypothetical protein [Thermoleophilaceae bacterium]